MKPVHALRSVLFYAGYAGSLMLASVVMSLLGVLGRRQGALRAGALWCRFAVAWARLSCGMRYEVSGLENIPDGPVLVMARHESAWETLLLQSLFYPASTVLKRELLWIPFFGWGLHFCDPIAIDRRERGNALKAVLRQGEARLAAGRRILIFPEGTRALPGEKLPYSAGGAMLAVRAGVPVLPVALTSGDCWPRGRLVKTPGLIRVVIGAPMASLGQAPKALTAQVQEWIDTQVELLRPEAAPVTA